MSKPDKRLTVVRLEQRAAVTATCARSGTSFRIEDTTEWNPSSHLCDADGQRLMEEIERQVLTVWSRLGPADAVALTIPGTLRGDTLIESSSRLGIKTAVDVDASLGRRLGVKTRVFHDVTCMAIGEWASGPPTSDVPGEPPVLAYVFADEGIGSRVLINGQPYVGAGAAGVLGRLVVQPDGTYFKELASRGPLEVYASRPWVSENLVCLYASEASKRGVPPPPRGERTPFRRALEVARNGDWRELDYMRIANGVATDDPIALDVLDVAARYLGFAINALITVLHPHKIVLGGAMFTGIPKFGENTIAHARQFCWPLAWNRIVTEISTTDRKDQVLGACSLLERSV